jgi:hypothetical protein
MYQQSITHINRTAIVIAIDSSISMQEWTTLHNTPMRKMEAASIIANFIIDELTLRTTRGEEVRNYYDIMVIAYSGDGVEVVVGDEHGGMIGISHLVENTPQPKCYHINQECNQERGISTPITLHEWVSPKACGTTPIYEAFSHIKRVLSDWCDNPHNRDSFPPLVINISDGGCNDADYNDIVDIAKDIKELHTFDGSTLFVNIYLATDEGQNNCSLVFPEEEETIADEQERLLYEMSSTLPEELEHVIYELSRHKCHRARKCFARNASICEVLAFANIGTEGCMGIKHR